MDSCLFPAFISNEDEWEMRRRRNSFDFSKRNKRGKWNWKIRSVFILRKKKGAKRGTKRRKDMFSHFLLRVLFQNENFKRKSFSSYFCLSLIHSLKKEKQYKIKMNSTSSYFRYLSIIKKGRMKMRWKWCILLFFLTLFSKWKILGGFKESVFPSYFPLSSSPWKGRDVENKMKISPSFSHPLISIL